MEWKQEIISFILWSGCLGDERTGLTIVKFKIQATEEFGEWQFIFPERPGSF